jgi:hypothetical protein
MATYINSKPLITKSKLDGSNWIKWTSEFKRLSVEYEFYPLAQTLKVEQNQNTLNIRFYNAIYDNSTSTIQRIMDIDHSDLSGVAAWIALSKLYTAKNVFKLGDDNIVYSNTVIQKVDLFLVEG